MNKNLTIKLKEFSKTTGFSIEKICIAAKQVGISLRPDPSNYLNFNEVNEVLNALEPDFKETIKHKYNERKVETSAPKRLSKVAAELNISLPQLVEFLSGKGHTFSNPNEKLPEALYSLALKEYEAGKIINEIKEKLFNAKQPKFVDAYLSNVDFQCLAIGKLLFFDYNKNKFGFISLIKSLKDVNQTDKIHVSESGLSTDKHLNDGEIITFTLNKNYKGYFATNVKPFSEIDLRTASLFENLVGISELEKAIYNSVKSDYKSLDSTEKEFILKIIRRENKSEGWVVLNKIEFDELIIQDYISELITQLEDKEKITFLTKSFNSNLLNNILSNWKTQNKSEIINLVDAIKNKELTPKQSEYIIKIITIVKWEIEEIWKIFLVLKVTKIADIILNQFSFQIKDNIDKLKVIIPVYSNYEIEINYLRNRLLSEINLLSTDVLINIFQNSNDYNIIENENQLLGFIHDKEVKYSDLKNLISVLTNNCKLDLFRKVITNNITNIAAWEIIELIELNKNANNLIKVLLDEYFSNAKEDYLRLIDFFDKNDFYQELTAYFIDEFYKILSKKHPLQFLKLAVKNNHINAQKQAYSNITFNTENEIINFIEKRIYENISDEIKTLNRPLTAFILFINSTSNFKLTEDCKQFFQTNKGIVQCISVKFLISQLYKKVISKAKLLEILNSYQWSEISALIIKAFVQESNYTEKVLIEKLSEIFKAHFEVLLTQEFSAKSFMDSFTIHNILNRCNGRKYYNGKFWQNNGISRLYVKGQVSISSRETLNCYCEGRPWKKETFYDSDSNKAIPEQFDKYWCKTNYCAARNDSVDINQPFYKWNIPEISFALNISIEKIALATLAGWANRMNQIIEHLFCRKCNHILRPLSYRPKTLGYYAVPVFHCINESCSEKQKIRFTHCLNSKCESHISSEPLDSRDCKSCKPNDPTHTGLECNFCGAKCPACSGHFNKITVEDMW